MTSPWLDVAIAVVFVLFVNSLIVSGVNEGFVWVTQVRSKQLWASLTRLATPVGTQAEVAGGEILARLWRLCRRLLDVLYRIPFGRKGHDHRPFVGVVSPEGAPGEQRFVEALRDTAAVRSLETAVGGRTAIRNIPTPVFSEALTELANDDGRLRDLLEGLDPRSPLRRFLTDLGPRVESNLDRFRDEVGHWYDTQMGFVSRTYRRDSRKVMTVFALLLAMAWNLDAFAIIGSAQRDSDLRDALVVAASQATTQAAPSCDLPSTGDAVADAAARYRCLSAQVTRAKSLDLTTYWDFDGPCRSGKPCDGWWERAADVPASMFDMVRHHPVSALGRLVGWMVTAIALSFGATFWFDALKRLVGYRRVEPAKGAG